MESTATLAPIQHIALDENGRPYIQGTRLRVVNLMSIKLAYGWTTEQLKENYPHLSLAQIHALLSYYYDHQAAIDAEMRRLDEEFDRHYAEHHDPTLRQRLLDRLKHS